MNEPNKNANYFSRYKVRLARIVLPEEDGIAEGIAETVWISTHHDWRRVDRFGRFVVWKEDTERASYDLATDTSRRYRITDTIADLPSSDVFTIEVPAFTNVSSITEARIVIASYLDSGRWELPDWYLQLDFSSRSVNRPNYPYGIRRHTKSDEARALLAGREIGSSLPGSDPITDQQGPLDCEQQRLVDRGRRQLARAAKLAAKSRRSPIPI